MVMTINAMALRWSHATTISDSWPLHACLESFHNQAATVHQVRKQGSAHQFVIQDRHAAQIVHVGDTQSGRKPLKGLVLRRLNGDDQVAAELGIVQRHVNLEERDGNGEADTFPCILIC